MSGTARLLVGLLLFVAVFMLVVGLAQPKQNCTGGGKGTGEPVRCEPR